MLTKDLSLSPSHSLSLALTHSAIPGEEQARAEGGERTRACG